jgi:hypothetical protein
MYKLLLIAPLFFIGCGQTITKTEEMASVSFDSNYQPATFADAGRMEKIMQAFPVIDKILKIMLIQTIYLASLMD